MIQRSLILVKPDGVQRGIVGELISRFERVGMKIVAMKMHWVNKDFAEKHYFDVGERHGQRILNNLTGYLKQGPVIALCLEGINAIGNIRKMVGSTYPNEAMPGTIRGDYSHISKDFANEKDIPVGNLIHASANEKDAEYELKLWFTQEEMHSYKTINEKHTRGGE